MTRNGAGVGGAASPPCLRGASVAGRRGRRDKNKHNSWPQVAGGNGLSDPKSLPRWFVALQIWKRTLSEKIGALGFPEPSLARAGGVGGEAIP